MLRHFRLAAGRAALLLAFASVAAPPVRAATEAPAAAAAAPAPTPEALELAKRYMRVTGMERMTANMVHSFMPQLLDQLVKSSPDLTEAQRHLVVDIVTKAMDESSKPFFESYFEKATVIIAQTYTIDELKQVTAFYESPVGQSMLSKSPVLTQRAQAAMLSLMPGFQADLMDRIKKDMAAHKLPLPERTS